MHYIILNIYNFTNFYTYISFYNNIFLLYIYNFQIEVNSIFFTTNKC